MANAGANVFFSTWCVQPVFMRTSQQYSDVDEAIIGPANVSRILLTSGGVLKSLPGIQPSIMTSLIFDWWSFQSLSASSIDVAGMIMTRSLKDLAYRDCVSGLSSTMKMVGGCCVIVCLPCLSKRASSCRCAREGSNFWPPQCQCDALPLSYARIIGTIVKMSSVCNK